MCYCISCLSPSVSSICGVVPVQTGCLIYTVFLTNTLTDHLKEPTGCLFVSEYCTCTSWAPLFTSVFMRQLHPIWRIYVFQSLPILVVVIFAHQHMETCRCLGRERWPMDHEVLLFQVLLSGTLCHRPDPTCIDHYTRTVSEWTKDNTVLFGLRDMTRRFRDCLVSK